jgi:hypothetical protein
MNREHYTEIEKHLELLNWSSLIDFHEWMRENENQFVTKPKLLEITPSELNEALFYGYSHNI